MSRTAESHQTGNGTPWQLGIYLGSLWLIVGLAAPSAGLVTLPIQFFLKDRLHLGPQHIALFGAITAIPLYLGLLLGLLRDRWRPFGRGDRSYFLLGAPVALAAYLWLATHAVSYGRLVVAILIAGVAFQALATASQALTTSVAQRQLMTGRLSALSGVAQTLPAVAAATAGGWMVRHVSPSGIFVLAAVITSVFVLQSFWYPRMVFVPRREQAPGAKGGVEAIRRLLKDGRILPAVAILFLWNFSPASQTPYFYHLTETVRISSEAYGICLALFAASCIPGAVLYGCLCRHLPLQRLLGWATALAILHVPPYLLCYTTVGAMAVAVVTGSLCGFGHAAFRDLLMRSCPRGLEGTANALAASAIVAAMKGGDLFGTWLYLQGGFAVVVLATLLISLLLVPALRLVPPHVVVGREDERLSPQQAGTPAAIRTAVLLSPSAPRECAISSSAW